MSLGVKGLKTIFATCAKQVVLCRCDLGYDCPYVHPEFSLQVVEAEYETIYNFVFDFKMNFTKIMPEG
jgi:hypothetical protein